MPRQPERRTFVRVPVELPVVYWLPGSAGVKETGEATSIDLSGAGIRLRTVEPMRAGQPIEMELRPGTGQKPIRAQVRVVQSQTSSKEGTVTTQVAFQSIDEADLDRLVGFVLRRQIAARKKTKQK